MKPTRKYVSSDNQLKFVVDRDEQDVRLGFEGFSWHTHANVLASEFGTSEELAVNRFVRDRRDDTRRLDHCGSAIGSPLQV
jgi:hypothetical protein